MKVHIDRQALDAMLHLSRVQHPREVVLLLRGETINDEVHISEFLFPPFATSGRSFAEFPLHMLPIDFTVVGTAHSHPSGSLRPSTRDLNNFYSRVMVILAFPYREGDAAAYNSKGESIQLGVGG
ncbi:MAG: Mov34/MPN/PAD-1 family protein [Candidatus Bathyarchaeota archaeon]|nr:Mov34/MPN/PAD-1 family protein [Candidatus Bathyarchaeota archaeon]